MLERTTKEKERRASLASEYRGKRELKDKINRKDGCVTQKEKKERKIEGADRPKFEASDSSR